MSKNYLVGLTLAVLFLVAASAKADIYTVSDVPEGIFYELLMLNFDADNAWYPNTDDVDAAAKLGFTVTSGRYEEGSLQGDFWVTVSGISPAVSHAALTGTMGPWHVYVNDTMEWAGSNYWKATGAEAMYFPWGDDDTFTLSFREIYGYDGNGGSVWLQPFTLTFYTDKAPAATPEPATLAIIGLGLAGLGLASRRRRK